MRVQVELRARGSYYGPIDGRLSADTQSAIRAFQTAQQLRATGYMDNETLARLGIAY
ncbi:peptidoglycan-binding domain-containing protein [Microvirga zambiensis]|uniref:peptidoglycan-binding domain-containing protein n=1 Tax=Microvirga zambiensis TaxID=1402137 RepID=UPI003CCCA89E